jgi:hypothetical protein
MSFADWDWASAAHDVTVLNDADAVLTRGRSRIPRPDGKWPCRLRRHGCPHDLPVIIEKTSGLIADRGGKSPGEVSQE